MKTTEIVSGLLKLAKWVEFGNDGACHACGEYVDHLPSCKWVELTEAAAEYLKLMEGAKK